MSVLINRKPHFILDCNWIQLVFEGQLFLTDTNVYRAFMRMYWRFSIVWHMDWKVFIPPLSLIHAHVWLHLGCKFSSILWWPALENSAFLLVLSIHLIKHLNRQLINIRILCKCLRLLFRLVSLIEQGKRGMLFRIHVKSLIDGFALLKLALDILSSSGTAISHG